MESPEMKQGLKNKSTNEVLLKSEEKGVVSTQLHRVLIIRAFCVISRDGPDCLGPARIQCLATVGSRVWWAHSK
jgi:hypothetical protein